MNALPVAREEMIEHEYSRSGKKHHRMIANKSLLDHPLSTRTTSPNILLYIDEREVLHKAMLRICPGLPVWTSRSSRTTDAYQKKNWMKNEGNGSSAMTNIQHISQVFSHWPSAFPFVLQTPSTASGSSIEGVVVALKDGPLILRKRR